MKLLSILLLLSDFMNVHFKTRYWNGTIWKRFFDKPEKRTSLWALSLLLPDVPMRPGVFSLSKRTHSWKEKGQALSASSRKKGCKRTACHRRALAGCLLSPFIWVCMFLCTMDFALDFFHQVHFSHYSRHFLSEALCFAREKPEVEGKVKLKSVLFHSNMCCLTFSQLFRLFFSQ